VARVREMQYLYRILVGKTEGRYWHRWEDNTKTNLKETGCEGVDWVHVALD
jgi:hypothetical protein